MVMSFETCVAMLVTRIYTDTAIENETLVGKCTVDC